LMVRTFHCFPYFFKRFHNYEEDEQRNNLKLFMLQNSYDEVMWFSKKMMEIILPFGLGAVLMVLDYMTFAHVIAFTVANDLFSKGFNNMINAIISINSCLPHIDAVNEFLDEPEEKAESHDKVDDVGKLPTGLNQEIRSECLVRKDSKKGYPACQAAEGTA